MPVPIISCRTMLAGMRLAPVNFSCLVSRHVQSIWSRGLANQDKIPLQWMDVSIEAYRDPEATAGDITVYDAIRVHFEMWGVQAEHAEGLVETWKRRCPLYGSVATATRDTNVTLTSHTEAHSR